MDATDASMIVDENVPPHPKSWQHHDAVRMQAQALGLHSRASYLDVSHVDTAPSRTFWIHSSSRSSLPARIDIAHLSGMSSLSKPVSDILEPTASVPSSCWINDAHVANCLIDDAFHHTQWHGTRSVDHATVHICMRTYIYPTTARRPDPSPRHPYRRFPLLFISSPLITPSHDRPFSGLSTRVARLFEKGLCNPGRRSLRQNL